ncbi:uncharacterized protein YoxC [Desulfobaculum xiamenense]|uniref:Uncharacterized protein YoxC n=1 Tax=Desulfobaculum xiamenense TaxID=995050 RepID=A0A846QNT7_9BACT|nr:hypothetical protein [Desulfobaculum xiamenense]NJB66369.1 uncharacterized protein YoxC [Desulfobaculum xiamenense]
MSAAEKIHHIGKANGAKVERIAEPAPEAQAIMDRTNRDMGKVALLVSIMSVILLVVFFFGLNQNLTSLTEQVSVIPGMQQQIQGIDGKIAGIETELGALKDLPAKTKKMVVGTMLQEMAQKAGYLGSQMESDAQNAKLQQAMQLMQEVQADMQK